MAIEVELDQVVGCTATRHLINGVSVTRMATAKNLGSYSDVGAAFEAAMAAILSAVGGIGEACPGISEPTYLESVVPETVSTDIVRVRLIYKGYPVAQTEIHSTLAQIPTNVDKDG